MVLRMSLHKNLFVITIGLMSTVIETPIFQSMVAYVWNEAELQEFV